MTIDSINGTSSLGGPLNERGTITPGDTVIAPGSNKMDVPGEPVVTKEGDIVTLGSTYETFQTYGPPAVSSSDDPTGGDDPDAGGDPNDPIGNPPPSDPPPDGP